MFYIKTARIIFQKFQSLKRLVVIIRKTKSRKLSVKYYFTNIYVFIDWQAFYKIIVVLIQLQFLLIISVVLDK